MVPGGWTLHAHYIPPLGGWGDLRDQEPPGLLGHPQTHGQTDDQIQDQQQQIGQPPMRQGKQNIGITTD